MGLDSPDNHFTSKNLLLKSLFFLLNTSSEANHHIIMMSFQQSEVKKTLYIAQPCSAAPEPDPNQDKGGGRRH